MIVSAGWWIAIVELVPASARPYIGGSSTNSILELTLGLQRSRPVERATRPARSAAGRATPGGVVRPGCSGCSAVSSRRQIAWLLPAALLATVVLVVAAGKAARTDRTRAFAILWGGWLVVTGLVFSYMQGIIHSYYMIALAPAIGALIGAAATVLWRRRTEWLPRATLAGGTLLTAGWSFSLLNADADVECRGCAGRCWSPGCWRLALVLMLPELEAAPCGGTA